jgi:hypothetical protein
MRKPFCYIVLICLSISCSRDIPFDQEKWNEKVDFFYTYRKQMVNDLVNNHLKLGMKLNEIECLLGKPDGIDSISTEKNGIIYGIIEDYGWDIDPIETQDLILTFNTDSSLCRVKLTTWKSLKGTTINDLLTQ